jgi:hypothetical protein
MGAQRTTFEKLQRDRAKKAKAAQKRERRLQRGPDDDNNGVVAAPVTDGQGELSAAELLEAIERIHRERQVGTLSEEDFEEQKANLLARLPVD